MKRRCLGLLAVAVGVVALSGCRHDATPPPASSAPASKPTVEAVRVVARTLDTTISLPGEMMPYEAVDVFAHETGFLKSIAVDRGSKVRRGEVLAELEAPELLARRAQAQAAYQGAQSQLAAAQAKVASDRATYERLREAAKSPGVVAGNDLDVAGRSVETGEAGAAALQEGVEAAKQALQAVAELESYLTIRAPFDGEVTARYVHPGALVGASGAGATPIVRLQTVTRDRLVVAVPETASAGVAEGTMVSFTVPSFPGRHFQAPIARSAGAVDAKTRTMPVELDVRDEKGELAPGTFCDVEWPVRRGYPTLFVPATSVASNLQRTFVVRLKDNRAEWVDVKSGARTGNTIEVFGDLTAGDLVAVRGTDQLRPGSEVEPKPAASAP